jgi:hypothetical protein
VQVVLSFAGWAPIHRLSTGKEVQVPASTLRLEMQPYQLMAFTSSSRLSIRKVTETIPEADRDRLKNQVDWLTQLAADVREKKTGTGLDAWTTGKLYDMASEAATSFNAGHTWRARTLLENHVLLSVYEAINRFPPDLREMRAPTVPSTALRVEDLAKMAETPLRMVPSETVTPGWSGDQVLESEAPETRIALPIPVSGHYRIAVGHAAGGEYGPVEGEIAGASLGSTAVESTDPHAASTRFDPVVALPEGNPILALRRIAGARTVMSWIDVKPVFHPLTRDGWSVIGPFPETAGGAAGDGMAKVYPPEEKRDLTAEVELSPGKAARWKPLEGGSDFINLADSYGLGGISYAVTNIQVPTPRKMRFSFGVDYWAKVWLNGELVEDLSQRGMAPAKGQFVFDANLKAGWNEVLVKLRSGSGGNAFWLGVSDPGDVKVARQAG